MSLEQLFLDLEAISAVKFGSFTLKSGIQSPIYFDLRVIVSHPKIMRRVSEILWQVRDTSVPISVVCGVPYTALPLATLMSAEHDIPMVIRRKEAKNYGTKKVLEGHFTKDDECLIVEDVVTSGSSVLETAKVLRQHGLKVTSAIVLLDREQGGKEMLKEHGIDLKAVCGMRKLLRIMTEHRRISEDMELRVQDFMNQAIAQSSPVAKSVTSLQQRLQRITSPIVKSLLEIMTRKQSNLCVAADVAKSEDLLRMARVLAPHICCLKTHVDALVDWNTEAEMSLTSIARDGDFLLLEDRKFADIGHTVEMQYAPICRWAHMVTVHAIAGPGTLDGLSRVMQSQAEPRGALIVAQMSSSGNLITSEYTQRCVELSNASGSVVAGFVSQSRLTDDLNILHWTPGVHLSNSGDDLSQRYISPVVAIKERGADIIIVGRGITSHPDMETRAKEYKTRAWTALVDSITSVGPTG